MSTLTPTVDRPRARYAWAGPGDVNAFFGLMLDNISDLILMAGLLVAVFGFPADFVLTRMIPGTALGVMVGDLIYTGMAFRLARRTGRSDVTAMPLGLDTPSTFGSVFLILGPAFLAAKGRGLGVDQAAQHAWYVGLTMLLASGVFKLICATVSPLIRRVVPRAGLLGSLVSIALVLISFLPLLDIAAAPVAGFTALAILLVTLTARWELPGRETAGVAAACLGFVTATALAGRPATGAPLLPIWAAVPVGLLLAAGLFGLLRWIGQVPGALLALAIGCALYYVLGLAGQGPGLGDRPGPLRPALPLPMAGWWAWIRGPGIWEEVLAYLPVALPLALATVVGGIDCTESAAAAGDEYPTGTIIAVEGLATIVGGLFGGVIQSTPYIGHPAYKAMGGRAGYTLATALFVGAAGLLGFFGWIFFLLPKPAVFPILVFVGLEITSQSFRATPRRHYPALALACVPALAYLAYLMVDRLSGEVDRLAAAGGATGPGFAAMSPEIQGFVQTITVLAGGFIVTSLLWGTALARILDGRMRAAAGTFALAAVLALVGVIHSPLKSGPMLWPWTALARLAEQGRTAATAGQTPYHWAAAYALMALAVALIGRFGRAPEPEPEDGSDVERPLGAVGAGHDVAI